MSDGIIGALIGGFMALGGAWLSFLLQRRHDARILRATLLAELVAARDVFARRDRSDPITEMLEAWKAGGEAPFAPLVAQVLKIDPAAAFPVYYARAGDLGCLDARDASAVVAYYSEALGLLRSAHLILSNVRVDVDSSAAAQQLLEDYRRLIAERQKLIDQLKGKNLAAA